jgi:NADPH-dependent 2,4-dienoyl-CoA reductase/sulfur reductase-like enzyme
MFPSTVLFVAAGQQLATLRSASDVLGPTALGVLVALGAAVALLPSLAARGLQRLRQRQRLAPWRGQRPRQFDTNLVVIGAGAGGLVSAYVAAAAGAKVTLVEARAMGGDCLNYGCVPSKALIQSAKVAHQVRTAAQFGVQAQALALDWPALMARIAKVIASIAPHDSVQRYIDLGVDVLQGHARIVNPWVVEVTQPGHDPKRIRTRSIVIAAGAQAVVPDLPGLQDVGFATSDTLWAQLATCKELPRRIVVLGGGPIGCELGQAFARLGARVTLVEAGERLLAREDADVSALVQAALEGDGVHVRTGHTALRCHQSPAETGVPGEKELVLRQSATELETTVAFDLLLVAVGRRARLSGYGLEALGLDTERTVPTNAYLQTIFPTIYAAGDVAGPYQLTHAAAHQAWYATVNALFGDFKRFAVDYRHLPQATFVAPEVARVGLNEQEAQAQGVPFEVTRFDLADLDRALCDTGNTPPTGFVKVLTPPSKDRILGVSIAAPQAAEMLAEYVLAMRHSLGLKAVLGTVHAYPTFTEANKYAAGAWQKAHVPRRLLALARAFHAWRLG